MHWKYPSVHEVIEIFNEYSFDEVDVGRPQVWNRAVEVTDKSAILFHYSSIVFRNILHINGIT